MSLLTVVRHAQARPFEKNSDCLSETGEQQARALGDYWERAGVTFDEVLCGTLQRHRQTAALALGAPPAISADWNEYDAEGILRGYPPPSSFPDNRAFQKVFEAAMEKWMTGSPDREGQSDVAVHGPAPRGEPFADFHARVLRGLRSIQEGPSNRKVVLFTSGGPIGVLVQTALGAPERSFADVNWRVRNCSISEFVFSRDRLSLDLFNSTPHLKQGIYTFR
jgi:broad specificity phosphatase PhoE